MKNRLIPFLILLIGSVSATFFKSWTIKEGYTIAIDNFDITGKFEKFSGTLVFDENNPEQSAGGT